MRIKTEYQCPSVVDSLLDPLDPVVPVGGPLVGCVIHHLLHVVSRLQVVQMQHKTPPQVFQRLRQEARQPRLHHLLHRVVDMLLVLPHHQERLDHQVEVQAERLTVDRPAHDFDHLLSQLEIGTFELHIPGWGDIEDKPKVNVDEVALVVDEDVAVMAVLYLQDVRDNRVGRLRLYEIVAGLLEIQVVFRAEFVDEVLVQRLFVDLADSVSGEGVGHAFDDTADVELFTRAIRDCFVRVQEQIQVVLLKDLLHESDDLQGQAVLPDIVEHFEDAGDLGSGCFGGHWGFGWGC